MSALEIHFGKNSTWTLPSDGRIASTSNSPSVIVDWKEAVNVALSSPLDFPSLDQALVPGDQLVLAVDPTMPALVDVVAATARWICERGTVEANIRIVLAGDGQWSSEELAELICQRCGLSIVVERHNLDDSEQMAYVAANEASDPIYLNRSLVDADVVIPITAARPSGSMDYFGPFGIFPLLSNRETRGKFHSLPSLADSQSHAQLRGWADQAAWWVGVLVGIQVIPAGGDQVSGIIAGQLESLEDAAQAALAAQWNKANTDSALVVAVIDGPPQSQSWLSVARGLATAQRHVALGGSIVLVTQLSQAVGSGLGRLRAPHQTPESIAKKLAQDASDDALAAAVLLQATNNYHVYLISRLRSDTVESLGMGAIADGAQLTRLMDQFPSCTILEAVQHRG